MSNLTVLQPTVKEARDPFSIAVDLEEVSARLSAIAGTINPMLLDLDLPTPKYYLLEVLIDRVAQEAGVVQRAAEAIHRVRKVTPSTEEGE
jgi:hypothetical protein